MIDILTVYPRRVIRYRRDQEALVYLELGQMFMRAEISFNEATTLSRRLAARRQMIETLRKGYPDGQY